MKKEKKPLIFESAPNKIQYCKLCNEFLDIRDHKINEDHYLIYAECRTCSKQYEIILRLETKKILNKDA